MIHAVLFDMDGVIFNTERLYARALPEISRKLGYDMDMAFFLRTLGISSHECRRLYTEVYGEHYPYDQAVVMLRDYILNYNRTRAVPLMEGVPDCLEALKARGLSIVLATSSPRRVVDELFHSLPRLDELFNGKICGDEVTTGKPAPEIYHKAAALAGYPSAQCLGVEDSASGLQAIRASGAYVVMVPDLLPFSPALEPYTDQVLESLHGLPALIDRLNGGQ